MTATMSERIRRATARGDTESVAFFERERERIRRDYAGVPVERIEADRAAHARKGFVGFAEGCLGCQGDCLGLALTDELILERRGLLPRVDARDARVWRWVSRIWHWCKQRSG